ncbi:MAG: MmgE/PrpD family protein [Alphaproteobacteria bacterium]|nr:MAG: MmgE/PrpD family protein [Alphaproteobacteria bacterium]
MSDADPQVTALLVRFVLETKIEAIPENVRGEGIRSLVNIIGCALGGSRHDAVNKAWAALQPFAGGAQVTLIGRSSAPMPSPPRSSTRSHAPSMRSTIPMLRQSCIRADRSWAPCSQLPKRSRSREPRRWLRSFSASRWCAASPRPSRWRRPMAISPGHKQASHAASVRLWRQLA